MAGRAGDRYRTGNRAIRGGQPRARGHLRIALVANREPDRVDALLADLPARTRKLLDLLSPGEHLPRLGAPVFLVHGREDPVVPFTESLRLERAARRAGVPARLVLVGEVDHIEGGRARSLREAWRLWATVHAFRLAATAPLR
jgi:fermentation-respiration switch protein FrsA (DUF1100 family)